MTPLPEGLPPFPPVPEGYSHWEYRGKAWKAENVLYTICEDGESCWFDDGEGINVISDAQGYEEYYYIEALPLPEEDAKTEVEKPDYEFLHAELLSHHSEMIDQAAMELAESRAEVERLRKEGKEWIKIAEQVTVEKNAVSDELTALREENKRLREWQPIGTAPEDRDEWFIVWYPATPFQIDVTKGSYTGYQKIEQGRPRGQWPEIEGLCWHALPTAPGDKGGGGVRRETNPPRRSCVDIPRDCY